jgi:ribosomal protein S18 acetylase RimI-like enzyme
MKHIAKTRPQRLAGATASVLDYTRTIVGRSVGRTVASDGQRMARTGMDQATRSLRADSAAARLVLLPAHPGHFDWIAQTLRDAAASGSFDTELATGSLASRLFFENLRQALSTGCFLDDRGGDAPAEVPASGYVLFLSKGARPPVPMGFSMFKSIGGLGFELWLVAIDRRYRGKGFCKALLQAALATPAGMLAHVARVNRAGADFEAMGKALGAAGYRQARDGPDVRWFVREDAPRALVRLVRDGGPRLAAG